MFDKPCLLPFFATKISRPIFPLSVCWRLNRTILAINFGSRCSENHGERCMQIFFGKFVSKAFGGRQGKRRFGSETFCQIGGI